MQIQNQTLEFKLKELHPKQVEVTTHPARHKRICAGRRFGKSILAGAEASFRALTERIPVWWVAPTFRNTQAAWTELTEQARQLKPHVKIFKDEFKIIYPGGGFVQVVSAAEPDNMRSVGLGGLILDEAAYVQQRAYTEVLAPALLDYDGWTYMISTPNGFNWFYDEYMREKNGADSYKSFHFTSYDNPYLPKGAIDKLRTTMTEKAFRQEVLAEFIADALAVFRNVDKCTYTTPPEYPVEGHSYVMGVDWGRKHDFTAISVWDATDAREVALDRFSQIGFGLQHGRIQALYDRWQPDVIIAEENAIGMANVEKLNELGLPVIAFRMTQPSKKVVVEAFALALERESVQILDDDTGTGELLGYSENVTKHGNIQYSAPEGGHDDTVVARMLAYHAFAEQIGDPTYLDW